MSTIRNILFVVYTTWLCLAVTFQFILLYFIMRHSPKNFRIFKWLLADSSMFQLVTIITCYFNQFGIITNVQPMLIETFGVCRHFEPRLCFFTYLTSVMSAILSNTAILATFYFKYRAVTKHVTTDSHVAKSLFMAHAPSALIFGLSVWFYQEMTPFFDQVSQNPQEFKKEESSIFAAISETSKAFPSISLALAFDAVWLPIVCGYFRRKVLQEVNMRMQRNSAIKRSQHSTFVTGLTIQVMVPTCLYPLAYAIFYFYYLNGLNIPVVDLYNYVLVGIPPLVDPIVCLYFVTPFRKTVQGWFGKSSSQVFSTSKAM